MPCRISRFLIYILNFLILLWASSSGQETLYPPGYDIVCEYDLSASNIDITDTLVITRTITNNEVFDVSGLYLADNLPFEFNIVSCDMAIDAEPISFFFSGRLPNQVLIDNDSYRWVIDFPIGPGEFTNILRSGQTLLLLYRLTCEVPGNYVLPFHTVCFYGNDSGFFTTSDTLRVLVQPENNIPTLSEWGMAFLALLLLAAGTIAVIWRKRAVTAYK